MAFTRLRIDLSNRELADEADSSVDALTRWVSEYPNTPPVVARQSSLVRVTDGAIQDLTESGLKDVLAQAAEFFVPSANGPDIPKYPPSEVVKVVLDRDARVFGLQQIRSVTTIPIISQDGKLIVEPGLHPSGVWYEPELDDVESYIGNVDEHDDVSAARDYLLTELLGGFDFDSDASRAHALALTLLPFVREFIGDAPTPLHVVIAPQPGAGKTTLVQTCLTPAIGSANLSVEPKDEEELRKRVTATLLRGSPVIFFDNLNQDLASGTLAATLTSTRWADRVLGASTEVLLENRLIWAATGNNVKTSNELRDRVCPIWLEPQRGVPARQRSEESFMHPEIILWAQKNRPQLVGACLTLVLHWLGGAARMLRDGTFLREGGRRQSQQTMGSFNNWSRVMGGILQEADVPGFLTNRDKLDWVDNDALETATFFEILLDWSKGEEFVTADVVSACRFDSPLNEHLPNSIGRGPNLGNQIGKWFGKHRDAVYGGIRLRGRTGRRLVWRLEEIA